MAGEQWVAGVVLSNGRTEMHFLWLGLPEGLERGLADTLEWNLSVFLQHAHAQGCSEMDFSLTRPPS